MIHIKLNINMIFFKNFVIEYVEYLGKYNTNKNNIIFNL